MRSSSREGDSFLNGPLTRVGKIAYSTFKLDDVAKSCLPLNRLEARKGEKAIPARYHKILLLIIQCFIMYVVDESFHCFIVGEISGFRSVSFSFR